jgi:DNA-binding response OmpR family regulator
MQKQKKCLIVEDNESNNDFMREWLKIYPFDLIFHTNIKAAKNALEAGLVNELGLLIVDIMLPSDQDAEETIRDLNEKRRVLLTKDKTGLKKSKMPSKFKVSDMLAAARLDKLIQGNLEMEGGIEIVETCRRMLADVDTQKPLAIPTLFLTGRSSYELERRAYNLVESGKATWLTKPVECQQIHDVLKQMLGCNKQQHTK